MEDQAGNDKQQKKKMNYPRKKIFLYISALLTLAVILIFSKLAIKSVKTKEGKKNISEIQDAGVRQSEKEELLRFKQEVYLFKVEGFDRDKRIQWGLEGESANVVDDKINIKNLRAVYYGGDVTLTIFADAAVYDKGTHDIELKNNIVGRTSDGGELTTDYARWDARTEEITTDSYVVVKRENISCKGKGLVTKPKLKQAALKHEIEVTIVPDRKITCDGPFHLDHEKNMAIFRNNVKITDRESETLTDRLMVYLDPKTNKVARVVTEGNVQVTHRGDVKDMHQPL